MDHAIARGLVRQDRRVIERNIDAAQGVLSTTVVDAVRPRFRSGRQLSGPDLRSLVSDVDRVFADRKPVVINEYSRPPPPRYPRREAYERTLVDILPIGNDGFLLSGAAFFANRKRVSVRTTNSGIFFTRHAAERVLERWGLTISGAYSVDQSPIRGIAVALVEQAGLCACFMREVSLRVMIPALGGLFLGDLTRPSEDGEKDMVRGQDVRIGLNSSIRKLRHHPFSDASLDVDLATFIHSYQAYPAQLEVKHKLEEFSANHRLALDTLGAHLLWREVELFGESASEGEIEAAALAFIPVAEMVNKLPAPRAQQTEEVA